jgi:flagellar hook-associated protein 2
VSSPITFSGFNQIDFNLILNSVMSQERAPLTRLETQKKTLETTNTAFGTLAGKLSTLETSIEALAKTDSFALLSATSNNTGVGVSSTGGTVTGTYDIIVTELAKAQVTASTSTYASLSTEAATGGTLTLTPANGDPATTITISGSTTLSGLAAAINADDSSPASASVVQTSPGVYRLMLTGKDTGTTNAFTVTNLLTGGAGVVFPGVNDQDAIDAAFSVNNLDVTSSSNIVSDVVPGVTLTLAKKDPATTVTVQVSRDATGAKDKIKKFITAYNDLVTFAKDQATAATAGKASIGRDPLLRGIREALRSAVTDEHLGGSLTRLAEIGVGFDITGKMTLDETLFDSRLASSPADVQLLLSGADGTGGAFGGMTAVVEEYTQTGGLLSSTRERIDGQIRALSRRIDTVSAQLELRRLSLQREYVAADLAMTRLKSQSSSLQAVGAGYRLF